MSPKFDEVFCSQCGEGFGPGDEGFSHCSSHTPTGREAWACLKAGTLPSRFSVRVEELDSDAGRHIALVWHDPGLWQYEALGRSPEGSDRIDDVIAMIEAEAHRYIETCSADVVEVRWHDGDVISRFERPGWDLGGFGEAAHWRRLHPVEVESRIR